MKELVRRHRKATDNLARWLAGANNARAMGDIAVQVDGARLVRLVEVFFRHLAPSHRYDCYCTQCVEAWERTSEEVERYAAHFGVDLKQHSFGALRRAAKE